MLTQKSVKNFVCFCKAEKFLKAILLLSLINLRLLKYLVFRLLKYLVFRMSSALITFWFCEIFERRLRV